MIYLDDAFPEHPKVDQAGGDAAWLYVCGLGWLKRQRSTDGRIPKSRVARLSDRKNPDRLARRLCDVRLWHDDGDAYAVNDYIEHNAKAIRISQQRREAALKKWSKSNPDADADGHAPAPANADAPADANASVSQMPQGTSNQEPSTGNQEPSSSSRRAHPRAAPAPPEDDDDLAQVWDLLARRRLAAQQSSPDAKPVRSKNRWLATTRADVADQHADHARKLRADQPDLTPTELADLLEPDEHDQADRHHAALERQGAEAIARLHAYRDGQGVPPPRPRSAS